MLKFRTWKVWILLGLAFGAWVGHMQGAKMNVNLKKTAESNPWLALNVSEQAYRDFQFFWQNFGEKPSKDFAVPKCIIWLNGAPGAGKGTNAGYIQEIFSITEPPLVVSDLLSSPEFQAIKDSGQLIGDREVTMALFEHLLSKKYANGVIVDGYPRTTTQAECVKLLADKIRAIGKSSDFQVVILDVSEDVSIERQLGRGRRAMLHNQRVQETGEGEMMPLRKTDVDPAAARTRYQVFLQQTDDALSVLQSTFPCHRINAEGSFEEVRSTLFSVFR